ncbi:MAG: hypothetical protein ACQRW7_02270 [Caulobacterales bacterium]|uniref:hypothetical protein n=1 Tax=Glycocaulis sp. TaxID=1969725 RepID=UPI003F9FFC10
MFRLGRQGRRPAGSLEDVLTALPYRQSMQFDPAQPNPISHQLVKSELLAGVGTDSLGSAIAMMKKFRDWATVRASTTLLRKVEAVCPDILFDLEQKLSFTSNLVEYSLHFMDWAQKALQAVEDARAAGDQQRMADAIVTLISGFAAFISQIGSYYHDFQSYFGKDTYDRYRENLNTLPNDDRRAIHAFYAHFEVAVASMARIYQQEIPAISRMGDIPAPFVVKWAVALTGSIGKLYSSALDLLQR